MATLHELAMKLQESIIQQQSDAHSSSNLNIHKYNNLKLTMKNEITYPHVIVSIGISEATYNVKDCTKVDGGLGSDEKYIRKWLGNSTVMESLLSIYNTINELIEADEMQEDELMEMSEGKAAGVRISKYNTIESKVLSNLKELHEEVIKEKKKTNKVPSDASTVSPNKIKKVDGKEVRGTNI